MKTLSFLQIGDIHFPQSRALTGHVDVHDSGFPPRMAVLLARTPLDTVMRHLLQLRGNIRDLAAILVCGDLTSQGDFAGYESCLKWLMRTLRLPSDSWPVERIHAVVGNHDVNRSLSDPNGQDLFQKFKPLENAWSNADLPILPIRNARHSAVTVDGCDTAIFSLNSCLGCGEERSLPDPIRKKLAALLLDASRTLPPVEAFALIGEQLDTPAFAKDDIDTVVERIRTVGTTSIPIILGHHNLLPQSTPRLSVYTELINGGLIRHMLMNCGGPVIYCHGHIHDDPIETVLPPQRRLHEGCRLLSIAAPLLSEGYNLVRVHFSRTKLPLGCTVHRFRLIRGIVSENTVEYLPLRDARDANVVADHLLSKVLNTLGRQTRTFSKVLERLRTATSTSHQERTLATALTEAEWLGLVHIENRSVECKHWHIRRIESP